MTTTYENLSATTVEIIDAMTADRDPRIERHYADGLASLVMSDAGDGIFDRTITTSEADELVALGLCRDDR